MIRGVGAPVAALLLAGGTAQAAADPQAACARTVLAYADAWDHHDAQAFSRLFTDDAVLELGTGPARGRAAIAALFAKLNPTATTRHLMSNIVVTPTSPIAAQGRSYLQLFAGPPAAPGKPAEVDGFALVGEYVDSFRIAGDSCRISDRRLDVVFRRAGRPPPPRPPAP